MKNLFIKGLLLSTIVLVVLTANLFAQTDFVYTNNDKPGSNTVTAFSVGQNGVLTQIPGSPFATGGIGSGDAGLFASNRASASVTGNFLYVINQVSNNVSVFSINPLTGGLTPVPGSPFSTGGVFTVSGNASGSVAATPDNRFLYVVHGPSGVISVFTIAPNGALTLIQGSPFSAGGESAGIKVSPDGRFLAVALVDDDTVAMFNILPNGTLTSVPGSPFFAPGSGFAAGLDIDCAGNFLFAGNASGIVVIDVFSISSNGALASISGSPFAFLDGSNSNVALLSPDDRFLFVSNQNSNSVSVFNVASDGSLSPVSGSPFFSLTNFTPQGMATNRAGTLLYVINEAGTLHVFNIAGNGVLTSVPGSPFPAGASQRSGIAAFPAKNCATPFDICLQDDSTRSTLKIDSTTGAYQFTRCTDGFILSGTGSLITRGGILTLQDFSTDRRVIATVDRNVKRGTASVQVFSAGATFTIMDRNTANNTCSCP